MGVMNQRPLVTPPPTHNPWQAKFAASGNPMPSQEPNSGVLPETFIRTLTADSVPTASHENTDMEEAFISQSM